MFHFLHPRLAKCIATENVILSAALMRAPVASWIMRARIGRA